VQELTRSQKGRLAIRAFKTIADALALRGYYKPSGTSGQTLERALRDISPEIYGSLDDNRSIEIKGLQYVIDRLPAGIEECTKIILTAKEDFDHTSFKKIEPPKRRRTSYRMSKSEICFVITRGWSEMYDVLTHLTFLNVEAYKIYNKMMNKSGHKTLEWKKLEEDLHLENSLEGEQLDKAIWNLSILIGRTYQETRDVFEYLEKGRKHADSNAGLFKIIYRLGKRVENEKTSKDNEMLVYFTPSFHDMVGHHIYSRTWAKLIKEKISELKLVCRPVHIISANMHGFVNLLYGYAALIKNKKKTEHEDIYAFINSIKNKTDKIIDFAKKHGLYELKDVSGTHIDCQIIDTAMLAGVSLHPALNVEKKNLTADSPILMVIDYAFGTQAFEIMEELLIHDDQETNNPMQNVRSISVMGKAGILPGKKGDIMLATAHVLEGTPHNYLINNDLKKEDFDDSVDVYTGPMVTVLGTSLQNRHILERFHSSSWKAIGLEMEGGHFQRAINAAIIRGHISKHVKVRYAYYASDNPLCSGETLASGGLGEEGIRPTYMITKIIFEKIMADENDQRIVSCE
jgi:hypothetical protein